MNDSIDFEVGDRVVYGRTENEEGVVCIVIPSPKQVALRAEFGNAIFKLTEESFRLIEPWPLDPECSHVTSYFLSPVGAIFSIRSDYCPKCGAKL